LGAQGPTGPGTAQGKKGTLDLGGRLPGFMKNRVRLLRIKPLTYREEQMQKKKYRVPRLMNRKKKPVWRSLL